MALATILVQRKRPSQAPPRARKMTIVLYSDPRPHRRRHHHHPKPPTKHRLLPGKAKGQGLPGKRNIKRELMTVMVILFHLPHHLSSPLMLIVRSPPLQHQLASPLLFLTALPMPTPNMTPQNECYRSLSPPPCTGGREDARQLGSELTASTPTLMTKTCLPLSPSSSSSLCHPFPPSPESAQLDGDDDDDDDDGNNDDDLCSRHPSPSPPLSNTTSTHGSTTLKLTLTTTPLPPFLPHP